MLRVNHSRTPNATMQWDEEKENMTLIALSDIKEAEEITIAYCCIENSPQAFALDMFLCNCPSCENDATIKGYAEYARLCKVEKEVRAILRAWEPSMGIESIFGPEVGQGGLSHIRNEFFSEISGFAAKTFPQGADEVWERLRPASTAEISASPPVVCTSTAGVSAPRGDDKNLIEPYTGASAVYVSPHREIIERFGQQVYVIGKSIKPNARFPLSDEAIRIKVKEREDLQIMRNSGDFRGKECLCEPCSNAVKRARGHRNDDDDDYDSTGSKFEDEDLYDGMADLNITAS